MKPALLCVLVCGTLLSCLWLWIFRRRLALSRWVIAPLAVLHTLVGVFCVKLFAGLESFELTVSGGMSLYGGIFLLPLFYAGVGKAFSRNLRTVFDVMTLCLISTLWFARINCLCVGCCRGLLLPGSDVLRWPTREAELVFHAVLLTVLARRLRRQEQPGTLYPFYMMAYGIFRFLTEWLREGTVIFLGLHPAHLWSLLSIVIGSSVYLELRERDRRRTAGRQKGGRKP